MKKIYLIAFFYFFLGFIKGQTIEVVVSDTIMSEVKYYSYLLTINFAGLNKTKKKNDFRNELSSKYTSKYVFLYEEQIGDPIDYYWGVTYEIKFKGLKDKEYFELKMDAEEHLYTLSLLDMKIVYGEKEKIRLIEKLLEKGTKKASILTQGMGRKLGELKNVAESDYSFQNTIPEDIVIIQKLGRTENFSDKNESAKRKTLILTFDTQK